LQKQLNYQSKTIFYRVSGTGKPVMLLHGFGEDSSVWDKQVAYLQPDFKVIVPDLPGSGKSEMVVDMSMEGLAEVVHAIMEAENAGTCPVIGHSMGGYITLALVEKHGKQVSAFGLFHSSAFADGEEKKAARKKGIAFIKENGPYEFLKTMIPNLYWEQNRKEKPGLVEEHLALAHNFSGDALVSYYEAMIARPDRTHLLRETTVPVLFIMGEHDTAVPVEDSLKQCHLPEKSYIHMLHLSGHMGMHEEPEKANSALKEFLMDPKIQY
jgi:pimeloyl-ACP methyl ester carboxylesterase